MLPIQPTHAKFPGPGRAAGSTGHPQAGSPLGEACLHGDHAAVKPLYIVKAASSRCHFVRCGTRLQNDRVAANARYQSGHLKPLAGMQRRVCSDLPYSWFTFALAGVMPIFCNSSTFYSRQSLKLQSQECTRPASTSSSNRSQQHPGRTILPYREPSLPPFFGAFLLLPSSF